MKTLSVKQEKFCVNYFKTGNATQSYINAGYKPEHAAVCASQLLNIPKIIDKLDSFKQGLELAAVLSVSQRKEKLSEIFLKSVKEPYSVRDGLQAVDLLNKMDKVYSDASAITNNTQVVFIIGKGYSDVPKVIEVVKSASTDNIAGS
jgi:phage terminase small subunit